MSLADRIQNLYTKKLLNLLIKIGEIADSIGLKAYIVGGFVRDLLLEKSNFDIDIMVEGDALPFATRVGQELNAECKLIERFHTAHIYLDDLTIDFSSARKEYYPQPGALPIISFSNIKDDLFRRDFTINAIALSITPSNPFELLDLFGGESDIINKTIRTLHSRSFIDDPTRLYRAIRFAERFGFCLDSKTDYHFYKAINNNLPSKLSIKRIASEIDKCFQEKYPLTLLSKYQDSNLLSYLHKDFSQKKLVDINFGKVRFTFSLLKTKYSKLSETSIYWSLLLSKIDFKEAKNLINNSGLPHSVVSQVINTISSFKSTMYNISNAKNNIEIYNSLKDTCPECIALLYLYNQNKDIENKLNNYINNLISIKPSISGKDLIEAGISPGPQIREILGKIIEKKIGGEKLTRKEELNLARTISNI